MPGVGAYSTEVDDLPPECARLTKVVRALCQIAGRDEPTIRAVADRCRISKSALGALLAGKAKRPNEGLLDRLWKEAEGAAATPADLPVTRDELRLLCHAVAQESLALLPCVHCRSGDREPAFAPVSRRPALDSQLPVPPLSSDRQRWTGLEGLISRLKADQLDDAAGVLRHTAITANPPEVAAAIAACETHGLAEAVEAATTYAARRTADDVIWIACELLDSGNTAAARSLLTLMRTAQTSALAD